MKIWRKCLLILLVPILMSAEPEVSKPGYLAKYTSPEGIIFLSYTKEWDEQKLKALHQELLRNKHGKEIYELTEVRVMADHDWDLGYYRRDHKDITLLYGDVRITPEEMRDTLSHEYGHHVGFTYFPDYTSTTSQYMKLRTLTSDPIVQSSYWNRDALGKHEWYPEEIIAEDYVQLYGAARHVSPKERGTSQLFSYRMTHENGHLVLIQKLPKAQAYFAQQTGFPIESNRTLSTFSSKVDSVKGHFLNYTIQRQEGLDYRFVLSYWKDGLIIKEIPFIIPKNGLEKGSIDLHHRVFDGSTEAENDNIPDDYQGEIRVRVEVINLFTSTGFDQQLATLKRTEKGSFQLEK